MRSLPLALFSLTLALVACGGSTQTGDDTDSGTSTDGGADSIVTDTSPPSDSSTNDSIAFDTGISDVSSDTPTSGCPASPPPPGSSCAPNDLECTWGDDPRVACRTDALCDKGAWIFSTVSPSCAGAAPTCPSPVPEGSACATRGEVCDDGAKSCACGCDLACTGPAWVCTSLDAGCPSTAPELGTSCSASSSSVCDYGNCKGGLAEQCSGGIWVRAKTACPG